MTATACAGLLGYKLWNRRDCESGLLQRIECVNQQIKVWCSSPLALPALPEAVSLLQLAFTDACAERTLYLMKQMCLLLGNMLSPLQAARGDTATENAFCTD